MSCSIVDGFVLNVNKNERNVWKNKTEVSPFNRRTKCILNTANIKPEMSIVIGVKIMLYMFDELEAFTDLRV